MLSKYRGNGDKDFTSVYFNSASKTVINFEYNLDKCFQEILYRIGIWINEVSGWVIESIEAQYVNISIYSPLSGGTYIELPHKLKHSMKGLINIKNNDNKRFHLNPSKTHPERIEKADKKRLMILITKVLVFLFLKGIILKLKRKIMFELMYFLMKMI